MRKPKQPPIKLRGEQNPYDETLQELREAIREAHGLLRDIKDVRREVADMISKSRQEWEDEAQKFVSKELDELGQSLQEFITAQREEIGKGFDKLYAQLNRSPEWADGKTIAELIGESIKKVEREGLIYANMIAKKSKQST